MKKKLKKVKAWAFEFEGELCWWAQPTKAGLIAEMKNNKLSDGYKPVPVYIVRRK